MIHATSQASAVQRKSFSFSALSSLALLGQLIQQTRDFSHKSGLPTFIILKEFLVMKSLEDVLEKHL